MHPATIEPIKREAKLQIEWAIVKLYVLDKRIIINFELRLVYIRFVASSLSKIILFETENTFTFISTCRGVDDQIGKIDRSPLQAIKHETTA